MAVQLQHVPTSILLVSCFYCFVIDDVSNDASRNDGHKMITIMIVRTME